MEDPVKTKIANGKDRKQQEDWMQFGMIQTCRNRYVYWQHVFHKENIFVCLAWPVAGGENKTRKMQVATGYH